MPVERWGMFVLNEGKTWERSTSFIHKMLPMETYQHEGKNSYKNRGLLLCLHEALLQACYVD